MYLSLSIYIYVYIYIYALILNADLLTHTLKMLFVDLIFVVGDPVQWMQIGISRDVHI